MLTESPARDFSRHTDKQLFSAYLHCRGDAAEQAFLAFYQRHQADLCEYLAEAYGLAADAADDATQAAWLGLLDASRDASQQGQSLPCVRTLLYGMADDAADFYLWYRANERERVKTLKPARLDKLPPARQEGLPADLQAAVHQVLDALTDKQHDAVHKVLMWRVPMRQYAKQAGVDKASVRERLQQAKRKIAAHLLPVLT